MKKIGCEKKFCEIERQITIAKDNSNNSKLKGLNIALKEARANCSNESLIQDLTSEAEEIKQNILQYEQDLKEAQDDKKADKIIKYKNKIAEEKRDLKQVEAELSKMQKKS